MGFIDWFKKSFSRTNLTNLLIRGRPENYYFLSYNDIIKNGYASNPYVYAGVELIAKSVASIPVYLIDIENKNTVITNHPIINLLNKPNNSHTWSSFVKGIVSFYYLHGNVFIMKTNKERAKEIYLLNPENVEVILKNEPQIGSLPISHYIYTENGHRYEIEPSLVLHIKAFNPGVYWENNIYGLSPLKPASKSIILNNRAKDWNISLIENNARLSGALVSRERLPQKTKEELQKMINEIYSSPENAGRPILLEGGLDWKEMSLNPVELDWSNALKISATEICLVLGIPEELLHQSSNSSYANQRMAIKSFYYNTVIPFMRLLLENLNYWLVMPFGQNLRLTFDIDNIPALSEDAVEVWDRVIRARLAGILSKNEARRFLDQPDSEQDDFYTPANVLTTDIENSGNISPFTIRKVRKGGEED